MEQILMTKENELHTGDLWFNPNEPEKLCVFKNNEWEKIPDDEMQWSDTVSYTHLTLPTNSRV